MQTVVLISGKRYSGKDTAALGLKAQLLGSSKILALADMVRADYIKSLKNNDNISMDDLKHNDSVLKEQHRIPIIKLAEEMKIKHGKNYWAKRLFDTHIRDDDSGTQVFIISDWRFIEEYNYFYSLISSVVTIRINATEDTRRQRGYIFNESIDKGPSETSLDTYNKFKIVIDNDGTTNELYEWLHILYVLPTFVNYC